MDVLTARATAQLQATCKGAQTPEAQALLGGKISDGALAPGVALLFYAFEITATVTYNTNTIEVDMLTGTATAAAGAPGIHKGATGTDWEGADIPSITGLRAVLIEDQGGVGTRSMVVTLDNGAVIPIPQGGHLLVVAPEGKLLPAAWHTIQVGTDTAATQAFPKISVLAEYGD